MLRLYYCLVALLLFASCEKGEDAIVLPKPGTATHGGVEMGVNYTKQLFFDFASGQVVYSSDPKSWDLAFESSAEGKHVFMNGGNAVFIAKTGKQDFATVTALPGTLTTTSDEGWTYDDPSGLPGGTGIGDWWNSNGEVIIVRHPSGLKKLKMISADAHSYTFDWMPMSGSTTATRVTVTKDTGASLTYFSFANGTVKPDPPSKDSWDIVFTYYRELVYSFQVNKAVPYYVTGVLLNPYHTECAADSTEDFSQITLTSTQGIPLTDRRNAIGYDWKTFGLGTTGLYTVNRQKCYVLSTRNGELYKLHFLDFYNSGGVKGSPSFEYERLK